MATPARRRPFALLRLLLLVGLALFVTGVAGLYLLRRVERGGEATEEARGLSSRRRGLVMAGRGFDYEISEGDRKLFHIKAKKIVSDKDDNFTLKGVELTLTRDNGDVYYIESDRGTYNLENEQATLTGNVLFRGPRDIELTAEGLELSRRGQQLTSTGRVEFRFLGAYSGSANHMRILRPRNRFLLMGRVEVDSLPGAAPPMALRSKRLLYERDDRRLHLEGDVTLRRGEDYLEARRLSLQLDPTEQGLEFARANWAVEGGLVRPAEGSGSNRLRFGGSQLSATFAEGSRQPRKLELESERQEEAWVAVADDGGLERRVRARYLVADFDELGRAQRAQGFGGVEIEERVAFSGEPVVRRVCSETADATFLASGALGEVLLEGAVELEDAGTIAHGDRATADLESGLADLEGSDAFVLRRGGHLEAPRIVYRREAGEVEAGEGVRALIESRQGLEPGTDPARRQPIRIAAREAVWSDAENSVTFREQVRAWQGENLLLADKLIGELEADRLLAKGSVKTVWRPPAGKDPTKGPADEAPSGDRPAGGDTPGRGSASGGPALSGSEPLEIQAPSMTYARRERLVLYEGGARAQQAGRVLRCQDMRLELAEDDGFERLTCEGATRIEDPAAGNTVTGETAVYEPADRKARISGTPVVLRDRRGSQIQGRVLIYDFVTGTAEIQTEKAGPVASPPAAPAAPEQGQAGQP